jgi:GNAT superfamily N-acetyltransferase
MYTVRLARDYDIDDVYALARIFATSFAVEREAFRHSYSQLLNSPEAFLAVADVQSKVEGYILGFDHYTFYANGRVSWVEEIMVSEHVRRQGVGEQLMDKFEAWAAERGSRLVALATRRAASFYRAIGYEESAIYFRKKL